ncbi:Cyclic GMP-AMP synthase [Eumeta japonica]|uniref:Cyclic GMP-AMP synthase n=1 Tax=Eumeta variegata TaxID=151549 RepID=A0A4C1WV21_EUMVA|nr:Cyclic GMP-AMP synthase [Eumeta japonica]
MENTSNNVERQNRDESRWDWSWAKLALGGLGAAAVVTGGVLAARAVQRQRTASNRSESTDGSLDDDNDSASSVVTVGSQLLSMFLDSTRVFQESDLPPPSLSNLDSLLADVYRRHVALKDSDFDAYYAVYCDVFAELQEKMKAVDPYYAQYSSRKQFAGSHFDGLRIGRPDEFDVDIVIRIPLCHEQAPQPADSDLVVEPSEPGHVRLRGGRQYSALPFRDNWPVNRIAYGWRDDEGYLLRTKFTDWFKSVVARALNELPTSCGRPTVVVRGQTYYLKTRESGPACTLIVQRNDGFRLDVDLVPALKFSEARWPPSPDYRDIPLGSRAVDWMVVPKPVRGAGQLESARTWRVALHPQEKRLIYNHQRLRQIIRLMKKLRDAQQMNEIASYYIKTLFLWESAQRDSPAFWNQNESTIFKVMVQKLYEAVRDRRIPYFWNAENNLIGHVHPQVLRGYEVKLQKLVELLQEPRVPLDKVAQFLLTGDEYNAYKKFF